MKLAIKLNGIISNTMLCSQNRDLKYNRIYKLPVSSSCLGTFLWSLLRFKLSLLKIHNYVTTKQQVDFIGKLKYFPHNHTLPGTACGPNEALASHDQMDKCPHTFCQWTDPAPPGALWHDHVYQAC